MSDERRNRIKKETDYVWDNEKLFNEIYIANRNKPEKEWEEKGIPKLVDKIIKSYDKHKGITHLEGKDLPSKKAVIKILKNIKNY